MKSQIQEVARLLEEEILHYEKLVAALKKEAEILREGTPEDLLESVKAASAHAESISQIHRDARRKLEGILNSGDKNPERPLGDLLLLLPRAEARRLQAYQGALENLKNWVMQINARNKAFVQASLVHLREFFSFLNPSPSASPVYAPLGKKNPAKPLPVSLDRKV
jgi:flagellar biosynthesis/type III secretory pathway chaperone